MANDTILLRKIVAEDLDIGTGKVEAPAPSGGKNIGHRVNIASLGIPVAFTADFGTIAAESLGTADVTVNGAALGFPVIGAINANLGPGQYEIDFRVTAANTVRVAIFNRSPTQPATVGSQSGTVIVLPISLT